MDGADSEGDEGHGEEGLRPGGFKMKYNNQIILAAHRGDRKLFPENTMPAFESAVKFGADMIETDIHMTADGELIIMHDRNALRTTGFDGLTNEMTLKDIEKLDAGRLFSDQFAHTAVPTVQEFIAFIKPTGLLINWELKDYPTELGDEFAFRSADRLADLIIGSGLSERSMFNSFSDRVLEHIRLKYGDTFAIHGQGIHNCQRTKDKAGMDQKTLYDWCCLYPDVKGASPLDFPENFRYCADHSVLPCVCVKDEMEAYKKYIGLGCRMFTSNDIYEADRILRALKAR